MVDKGDAESIALAKENWERARGDPCPCCKQDTLRWVGKTCHWCARSVPDQVAAFLQKVGMPTRVEDNETRADLLGHCLVVQFSPERSALHFTTPHSGDRRLFQGLARELQGWASAKGLSLSMKGEG